MTLSFYINNIQENESSSLKPDKSVLLSEQNKKECDLVYSEIFCFFFMSEYQGKCNISKNYHQVK